MKRLIFTRNYIDIFARQHWFVHLINKPSTIIYDNLPGTDLEVSG